MPAPSQLKGDWSWKRAFALAFAVGIRPCTGAILVLVFAIGQGLWWAGVFSTFAMAIGTAITALGAGNHGGRLPRAGKAPCGQRRLVEMGRPRAVGRRSGWGSLVLVLGAVFFLASLGNTQPF